MFKHYKNKMECKSFFSFSTFNFSLIHAFTLAEVLIVLVIIGVVAALTIPTVISNAQDAQFKSEWKKAYATFAAATQRMLSENDNIATIIDNDEDSMRLLYKPYLSLATDCPYGAVYGKCWHEEGGWQLADKSFPSYMQSGEEAVASYEGAGAVLADGTLVRYVTYGGCTGHGVDKCGYIMVDVNGFKKPNILGKDIYAIHLFTTKVTPFGTEGDGNENSCTTDGFGCSAEYLYK